MYGGLFARTVVRFAKGIWFVIIGMLRCVGPAHVKRKYKYVSSDYCISCGDYNYGQCNSSFVRVRCLSPVVNTATLRLQVRKTLIYVAARKANCMALACKGSDWM